MEAPAVPGWRINLTWGQKVAAYWSISWPALIGSFALVSLTRRIPLLYPLIGNPAFFGFQAILIHRLVRKNYRTFSVGVLHDDGQQNRKLSLPEGGLVWLWLLGPQLAVFLAASVVLVS